MIWHCMALELFIAFKTIEILHLHPFRIYEYIQLKDYHQN